MLSQKKLEISNLSVYTSSTSISSFINKTIVKNNNLLSLRKAYNYSTGRYTYGFTNCDTALNVNWQKNFDYTPSYAFQATDFVQSNNSLFTVGALFQDTINQYDWFFAKHALNGDTLFVKTNIDTASTFPLNIIKTDTNELTIMMIEGPSYVYSPYARTVLVKTDTNGVITLKKNGPYNLKEPQKILFNKPLNKYYVMGTYRTSSSSTYNVKYYIETYDSVFNLTASHNMSSGSINERFFDAILSNNKIYYTTSWMTTLPPNPNLFSQIRFNVVDPENNFNTPQYSSSVGPYDLYDFIHTSNILKLSNELFSFSIWEPYTRNLLVFSDTLTNTTCSSFLLQDSLFDYQIASLCALNNSMFASGQLEDTSTVTAPYKPFIAKTKNYIKFLKDSCSYLPSNIEDLFQEDEKELSLFPNPTTSQIFINLKNKKTYNYQIFDASGKRIMRGTLDDNSNVINLDLLSDGLYLLKIDCFGESTVLKFIKQS